MTEPQKPVSTALIGSVGVAALVIIIAGLKLASSLITPFMMAVFIAVMCAPLMGWLQRHKVPGGLAVILVFCLLSALGGLLLVVVGASFDEFVKAMPEYQSRLQDKTDALMAWLAAHGVPVPEDERARQLDPSRIMQFAASTLSGVGAVLSSTLLILLTVVFILLEASGFPEKLRAALPGAETHLAQAERMMAGVNHYLALKTLFSLLTGLIIWLGLTLMGVNHAPLWGLIAFLLNYIPNIGSVLAAVPAVLLAMVQLGFLMALLVAGLYGAVNVIIGSVMEPRFMGHRLGLSALVVFVSLVFWGWVLGPVGMLLSVPLTMMLKIVLEGHDDTRWLGILLGSASTASEPVLPEASPAADEGPAA